MTRLIPQLLSLLTRRQRVRAALLLLAMAVRAGVDLVGIASIAPFLAIVADPGVIHRNRYLQWLFTHGGFASERGFLMAVGTAMLLVLVASNALSALTTWATQRFVWNANHSLSLRLLGGYLAQPYSFFVQRNSASLSQNILREVNMAVGGVLMTSLGLVAQGLVTVAITGMLVALDPLLALVVVVVLGGAYGLAYVAVRKSQTKLGRRRVEAGTLLYKTTAEAFGGIKDVKALQRERAFLTQLRGPSRRYTRAMAANAAISQLPRHVLEPLAFGGVIVIVLYSLHAGQGVSTIVPVVGLYAFAGYRLMPALQGLFGALVGIRFNRASLDELCADLETIGANHAPPAALPDPLPFAEAIRLEGVSFSYPGAAGPAVHDLSLTIRRHETVGLVGSTGSGKTTLVDLLLGLYEPDAGRLTVDGQPVDAATIPAWRRQIGYVPQHIFLVDDTVARNIAFGVPDDEIDQRRVERAARVASLQELIAALPEGYRTVVGERGVRLSGGQRQRIGIARALYHDPEVLVLDEATSALDGVTESAVMDAIRELAGQKTIILIAHRLTTVERADRIFMIEDGRVVDEGTYRELTARNATFRAMAKVSTGTRSV